MTQNPGDRNLKILCKLIAILFFALFKSRRQLALENVALRQQLIIQQRTIKKPKITNADRAFWIWLSNIWDNWKSALIVVKPETVIGWHRKGFKYYWRRKSKSVGRPKIDWDLIQLIRKLQKENPLWSPQRIQGELAKLGYCVCENTVAKYMQKPKSSPEKVGSWLTFLRNHSLSTIGIDFMVVRSLCFQAIYVFVAISHDRRKILHLGVSSRPHSRWAIQQLRETLAFDETTRYIVRDNDKIFSDAFKATIARFGIEDKPTAFRSPWQNPYCERVIGTLRRECLDHVIVLNEKHLMNILNEYVEYYNASRTHMSLGKDPPIPRARQTKGKIVSRSVLGGLHHVYKRVA